jgi:MFS transporter, SP family, sugar:H+ symporter
MFIPEVSLIASLCRECTNCRSCTKSPRWLLLQDRPEDALNALRQVREGKFSPEEIEAELAMILHAVRTETKQLPIINIFRGTNATRTMIVVGSNVFMQASGQIFAQVYGALFVKSLGTVNPFTISVVLAVVNLCTAVAAMIMIDKVGRRLVNPPYHHSIGHR